MREEVSGQLKKSSFLFCFFEITIFLKILKLALLLIIYSYAVDTLVNGKPSASTHS